MEASQIIEMCKISEMRYHTTVFESGILYLEFETCEDEFYVSEIAHTKEFWNWWTKVVEERNKLFLKEFSYSYLSTRELFYIWESLLNVRSLCIYPPAEIWSAGYEDVIQNILKTTKHGKTA